MSTDTKPTEPKPRTNLSREERGLPKDTPGIDMEWIRIDRHLKLPGHASTDHVKAETNPNGRRWSIEFIPQLRHYSVTFYPADQSTPETDLIPEGRVTHARPLVRSAPAPAAAPARK